MGRGDRKHAERRRRNQLRRGHGQLGVAVANSNVNKGLLTSPDEYIARAHAWHGSKIDAYGKAQDELEREENEEEQRVQEERARRWRPIRAVLRQCGFERLNAEVEQLRDDGVIVSLYDPSSVQKGLLGAVTAFVDGEGGTGAEAVARLGVTQAEACLLQRAICSAM